MDAPWSHLECDEDHGDQGPDRVILHLQIGREWSLQAQQEADMERDQTEFNEFELTAEELDSVSSGLKNNQTEAWAWFQLGMAKGFAEQGGIGCWTHLS
ncbi:hypothetical protein XI06_41935 [Bradyrhizobium sp. CCBAU 11434]|nr:hypothetical protein [Bradyrhizobium sp. CCBAU 11434]